MKKHIRSIAGSLVLSLSALAVAGGIALSPAPVLAQDDNNNRPRRSQTLDPAVAKVLQTVFEQMQAEQYREALTALNNLIANRGERMKPYDKSTTYELRGSVKASLEDYRGAQRDFQTALDTNGLTPERNNQLRYFIAQISFQLEDFNGAIRGLNEWIRNARAAGETIDPNAYYLLAAAYASKEPPDYRAAQSPAEQVVANRTEPKKADHDLLNLIYDQNNEGTKRAALLEKMINIWPGDGGYWRQLSGLYSQLGKDKDAFSVLEVAYRAGLLDKEAQILTLVNYYSFFDNPYRGARLLEREMNAGVVTRNTKNLQLLSQLWTQSREHKRAIPILEQAAQQSGTGELYYRLGQVLVADEQYAKGEQALANARSKGGLKAKQVGDSWMLTGTARFSRAGESRARRNRAREAFVNASRYDCCRSQANSWVAYIDAINSTEDAQDRLACTQEEEDRKATIDRLKQQIQVCRLQRSTDGDCGGLEQRLKDAEDNVPAICVKVRGGAVETESSDEAGAEGAQVQTDGGGDDSEADGGAVVEQDGANE